MIRDTSLDAYRRTDITAGQQRVLDAFSAGETMTRDDIAARTGMKLSSVCGRVHELLHDFSPPKLEELPARNGKHPLRLPIIDTTSEAYRHLCEVRTLAKMATDEDRKRYLAGVFERRGEKAYQRLRADVWALIQSREEVSA